MQSYVLNVWKASDSGTRGTEELVLSYKDNILLLLLVSDVPQEALKSIKMLEC